VQRAVRAIKAACPELVVITDVCLCEYMSHGKRAGADLIVT
jgi:porphobilinogen synthase